MDTASFETDQPVLNQVNNGHKSQFVTYILSNELSNERSNEHKTATT